MKTLTLVGLALVINACGRAPEGVGPKGIEAEAEPQFGLVGGGAVTADKGMGVGKMIPRGGEACTFTRIGQRHFLTAYHCLTNDGKTLYDKANILMQSARSDRPDSSQEFGFDSRFAVGSFKPFTGDTKNYWNLFAQIYNGYEDWVVFTLDHSQLEKSAEIHKYLNSHFDIKPLASRADAHMLEKVSSVGWGENSLPNDIIARCSTKRPITCASSVLDGATYDEALTPTPVKTAKFRIDLVGRATPAGAQGLIMHTRLAIPKDGLIRVPKSDVDWGILAPGDAGGPLLDRNNRILGVNGSLFNGGDALLGSWWALQLSTKVSPDAIRKILDASIVDSAKSEIFFGEAFAAFGYRMSAVTAKLKSTGEALAKVSCSGKELAGKDSLIALGNLVEGEDYVCFTGPSYGSLASDSITLEQPGNAKAAYRKTVDVKQEPRCDSFVETYPVSTDGFILTTPFLKENYDIRDPGPIVMTVARQSWENLRFSEARLLAVQSAYSDCWKFSSQGMDCELAPSPGRISFSAYGVTVDADTHTDPSRALQVDLTNILQAYKDSQDFRDSKDLLMLVSSAKPYAEEYFIEARLRVTGCPMQ
jgi:hypothetical protein